MFEPYREDEEDGSGLKWDDILFILFRHKSKILACAAAGFVAALAVYWFYPSQYESSAKLLVRYVLDGSALETLDAQIKVPLAQGDALMNSEAEILSSLDLVEQVVEEMRSEQGDVTPLDDAEKRAACEAIRAGLTVTPVRGTNIIFVALRHRDPVYAKRALEELVNLYSDKHAELHRASGAMAVVRKEAERVRAQLGAAEGELKKLKAQAGVTSLTEGINTLTAEGAKLEVALHSAEADVAEQRARLREMEKWLSAGAQTEAAPPAPRSVVQEYQAILTRLNKLRQIEFDLLSKYKEETGVVTVTRDQIQRLDARRRDLEKQHPTLTGASTESGPAEAQQTSLMLERARLAAVEAKTETLRSQLVSAQGRVKALSDLAPEISRLERAKELDEANDKQLQALLEKARMDKSMDPTRMPIGIVQRPSTGLKVLGKAKMKIMAALAGGGIGLGLAIAAILELLVDRSIKRSLELETRLRIPVLTSIPSLLTNGQARLRLQDQRFGNERELCVNGHRATPWEGGHFIRQFSEDMRDRLLVYFQMNEMNYRPKLVALTSCAEGAGTSTLAGGLAAALSETDGKVLLVDMHGGNFNLHPFFEGQPVFSLSDALGSRGAMCAAAENLYLATAALPMEDADSSTPRMLYNIVPRFKASEFDYVVFDLPSLEQSSSALTMARFMDKILLVVESEKSSAETVRRSYSALHAANPNVSAVLNKTKSYTPRWLGVAS